jgi:hypothetical protein
MKFSSMLFFISIIAVAESPQENYNGSPKKEDSPPPMGSIILQKGETMIRPDGKAIEADDGDDDQDCSSGSCKMYGKHGRRWYSGNSRHVGMTLDFGYVDSRFDKMDSTLDRGSARIGFNFSTEFKNWLRGYMGMRILWALGDKLDDDNTYAVDFDLGAKFYPMEGFLRPFFALGMVIGSYRAWSVASENSNSISFNKHASGTYIGANPGFGVQMQLTKYFSTDIKADYTLALGKDAWKMHGLGVGLGLNFGF